MSRTANRAPSHLRGLTYQVISTRWFLLVEMKTHIEDHPLQSFLKCSLQSRFNQKDPQEAAATVPRSSTQQLEEILELYGNMYTCELCANICTEKVYHCLVCCAGDFDLCLDCFSKGRHCLDTSHYLQEMLWIVQDYDCFYSSVQQDGKWIMTRGLGKRSV